MKVWELIEKLEEMDGNAEACFEDQEYGMTTIIQVREEKNVRPYNIHYYDYSKSLGKDEDETVNVVTVG